MVELVASGDAASPPWLPPKGQEGGILPPEEYFSTTSIGHGRERIAEVERRRPRTRDTINVNDIDGATPNYKVGKLIKNRPNFYSNQDIVGSSSIRLHRDTNKPDRCLDHSDIEGSKPRRQIFFQTSRKVDPLEPQYILPGFKELPPEAPKFIRDAYCVADIEGSKSSKLYSSVVRNTHTCDDIEGAQSKILHRSIARERDPMDVTDIAKKTFRSSRHTDPLQPTYHLYGDVVTDDDPKSRPRPLPKAKNAPFYSLETADVLLPRASSHSKFLRATNSTADIPGAQADTLQYAFRTNRNINPIDPQYVNLDGEIMHWKPRRKFHREEDLSSNDPLGQALEGFIRKTSLVGSPRSSLATSRSAENSFRSGSAKSTPRSVVEFGSTRSGSGPLCPALSLPNTQSPLEASTRSCQSPGRGMSSRSPSTSSSHNNSARSSRSSRSRHSSSGVDRLVLRSSDGSLRVPLTPSERRASEARRLDVQAVRDLL